MSEQCLSLSPSAPAERVPAREPRFSEGFHFSAPAAHQRPTTDRSTVVVVVVVVVVTNEPLVSASHKPHRATTGNERRNSGRNF